MLKKLTICYICCLIVIVVAADAGVLSPFLSWVHHIPFGDKACHFTLVGMLSFLISATLSVNMRRSRKRTVVLSTIATLAVLTSLEEISQSLLVARQFSELDLLANVAGTCVFGALALLIPTRPPVDAARLG